MTATPPPPLTDEQHAEIRARHEHSSTDDWQTHDDRGRLLAEVDRLRAERDQARAELAPYEILTAQQCPAKKHPDWLIDSENAHPCPWCETDRLRAELATAQRQTEAAHCRLHHIEAYVQEITTADDPIAIGLDLMPWLDGPLHRDDLATYRAAALAGGES